MKKKVKISVTLDDSKCHKCLHPFNNIMDSCGAGETWSLFRCSKCDQLHAAAHVPYGFIPDEVKKDKDIIIMENYYGQNTSYGMASALKPVFGDGMARQHGMYTEPEVIDRMKLAYDKGMEVGETHSNPSLFNRNKWIEENAK